MQKGRQGRQGMYGQRSNRGDEYGRGRSEHYDQYSDANLNDDHDDRYYDEDVDERSFRNGYQDEYNTSGDYERRNRDQNRDDYDYDRENYYRGNTYKGGYDAGYKNSNQRNRQGDWQTGNYGNRQSNSRQNSYNDYSDRGMEDPGYKDWSNMQGNESNRRRSRRAFGALSRGRNRNQGGNNNTRNLSYRSGTGGQDGMGNYGSTNGYGTTDRRRRTSNTSEYGGSWDSRNMSRERANDYDEGMGSDSGRQRNRTAFGSNARRDYGQSSSTSGKRKMGNMNSDWYHHN
jgi:hypothetical protein